MSIDLEYPLALKNFGLFHLSVREAAALIAKIRYLDREFDTSTVDYKIKEDCEPLYDSKLEEALEPVIKITEELLINGIDKGTLKTEYISRFYDDKIIPEDTFLEISVLCKWLEERNIGIAGLHGVGGSDGYLQYIDDENEVVEAMAATMETERAKVRNRKRYEEYKRTHENDEAFGLIVKIQELETELESYRTNNSTKPEKPISTTERNTLLEIILGIAIDKYGYDAKNPNKKSGVPKAIQDSLYNAKIPDPPTPETIRKKLQEAAGLPEGN